MSNGPLDGLRVVELEGLAPAPFACMLLADLGADVVRVDRPASTGGGPTARPTGAADVLGRGRRATGVDLKSESGRNFVLRLIERADVLVEGFRPGVMERLGLGPDECMQLNGRLIYGRMTGYGQTGPMATAAGHDINYIALSGALHTIGDAGGRPIPPANLLGDFAGGGMLLAFGILAALFERQTSGRGQVVDAAMVDGAAILSTFLHGQRAAGQWRDERGVNLVDGGAPFYDTFETADKKHVAVGAIEPQFFGELVDRLGLDVDPAAQMDPSQAVAIRAAIEQKLRERTRDEWAVLLETTDACVAPVLSLSEAPEHPHNVARATFITVAGVTQPAPAPRFSRTPPASPAPPPERGRFDHTILTDWAIGSDGVDAAISNAIQRPPWGA